MTLSHFLIFRDRDRDIGSDLVTKLTFPNKLRISNSNIDIKGKLLTTLESGQHSQILRYLFCQIFFSEW